MEKHYVCPACGGMSNTAGVCTTEGCHLKGQAMEECTCTDGKHSINLNDNA